MSDTRHVLDVWGDPLHWPKHPMNTAETDSFDLYCCPQCGAAVMNPYQHKAWHLQFDQCKGESR